MQPLSGAARPQDRAPSGPTGRAERPLRVCFVALKAHAALTDADPRGQLGGAEVQQVRIARGLVRRGIESCFVTYRPDGSHARQIDGIRLEWAFHPHAGLPGVRFLHPRATALFAAMRRADADIYYQRCAGAETGLVALFSHLLGRRFVYGVGSDSDCEPGLPTLAAPWERALFRFGLRRADAVVAQNQWQQAILRERWGIRATLIRSCAPRFDCADPEPGGPRRPPRLLWVGRLDPKKRPDFFAEMARLRPQWHFELVGDANAPSPYSRRVRGQLQRLPNVVLRGVVPYERMPQIYRDADLVVCTSRWEGFPNTFLEAWSLGRPVASTVDPDDLIAMHGLGVLGEDPDALVRGAEALLGDPARYAVAARRCRSYVERAHAPQVVVPAYERLFRGLIPRERPAAPDADGVNGAAPRRPASIASRRAWPLEPNR